MQKNILIHTAMGLFALLTSLSGAQAADANAVQLIGPDNSVRRFQIDTDHVVQFGSRTLVRKANTAETRQLKSLGSNRSSLKAIPGEAVSPLLKDEAGRRYGLPGGLIVTLKEDMSEAQARAQLKAAGLTPNRQITPRIWTAHSPAGLQTVEIANQQNARGLFADVSPNWWTRRARR